MMATNAVGDIKEKAMHQPLLSPDEPLVVVVSLGRCVYQYRTGLHLVNGSVTSQYYLNNIINPVIVPLHEQHRPDFIFMDDNVPAPQGPHHQGTACWRRGTSNGVACTFSRPNPIENLWDQLSRCVEGCNPAPQNLSDLRTAPSRRVGCHASADNKSTCEQHEALLSSCN